MTALGTGAELGAACRHGRVFACGRDEGEGRLGVAHPMISKDRLLNFFLQVRLPCAPRDVAVA